MEDTYLKTSLDIANEKAKYDEYVKNILSDKRVLSWILKYATEEYRTFDTADIYRYIEGQPQVGNISIMPGKTRLDKVIGLNSEIVIPNEGKSTFDIIFYTLHPTNKERSQIIINVEAQKDSSPGYDLVPRGVFYGARMISAQMNTIITSKDYAVRKVYSIWISMEEGRDANTIRSYSIQPKDLYGNFKGTDIYDLMTVVVIRLSKTEDAQDGNILHQMLTTLLSTKLSPDAKEKLLEDTYGIKMSDEQKEESKRMCNLSDMIEERGIEEGKRIGIEDTSLELIKNLMETLKMSAEQAMAALKIAPEERAKYLQRI